MAALLGRVEGKETSKMVKGRATRRAGIEGVGGAMGAPKTHRESTAERKGAQDSWGHRSQGRALSGKTMGTVCRRVHQRMQDRKRPQTWQVT